MPLQRFVVRTILHGLFASPADAGENKIEARHVARNERNHEHTRHVPGDVVTLECDADGLPSDPGQRALVRPGVLEAADAPPQPPRDPNADAQNAALERAAAQTAATEEGGKGAEELPKTVVAPPSNNSPKK